MAKKKKTVSKALTLKPQFLLASQVTVDAMFQVKPARTDLHALARAGASRALVADGGFAYPIIAALDERNYQCLHDRLLVLPGTPHDEINGIIVPDIAKEQLNAGLVVRVGKGHREGTEYVPLEIEVGQIVNYGKYAGTPVEIAGYKLVQLRECELHGRAG